MVISHNKIIRSVIRLMPRLRRKLRKYLRPCVEICAMGPKYEIVVDLSQGSLQEFFFLNAENYEFATQAVMRKFLKPGMTAIDIGAHTGFFTLLMADLVGVHGRVYSFEPHPQNYKLLKQNISHNSFSWVEAHNIALSNKTGQAILSINPVNEGGHSLGDFSNNPDLIGWDRQQLKVRVKTITLDAFVKGHNIDQIDFIKMDVEGAECLVIEGARDVLMGEKAPIILCEVGDKAQEQFGKKERDLRRLLYSIGYRSFFIGDKLREFNIETDVQGLPNILFLKNE